MKKLLLGLAIILVCVVIVALIAMAKRTNPVSDDHGSSKVNNTTVVTSGSDTPPAISQPEAIDALIEGLNGEHRLGQMSSALALAGSREPRALQALLDICPNRDISFRWRVAEVLGRARNLDFRDTLIAALDDHNWQVREFAVVSLANMHKAIGIEPLLLSLKNDDPYIRRIVCWQLGCIGDTQAIEPLIVDILRTYDSYEHTIWGAKGISMITKGKVYFAADLEKWEQWWEQNKHKYAKVSR